ncbi:MAG: alpha/beta hydrolase [Actinomycetota bacterium]|nr:alpha/beta hydrolase [Actinomycetota bacterium]
MPGRGTFFVRQLQGPPGAPTVVLLHGWTATADLNFFTCYKALGEHFGVIAFDHRGHGRGIRTVRPFRLSDCADDAAAVTATMGIDRFIAVGYSMGGPVAQLLWRRHRARVSGLVLCATASYFAGTRQQRLTFLGLTSLAGLARMTPPVARSWFTDQFHQRRTSQWEPWAIAETERHDWRMVLEAGGALGRFSSSDWIGEMDVPTSVVITRRDGVVPVRRQLELLGGISGARPVRVDGDHAAVINDAKRFVPALVAACTDVARRVRLAERATPRAAG